MNATSTISCIVQDVIPDSAGLKIHWADDHVSFYHYIWLADNAPEFRNSQGHRIHDSTLIPLTIRPRFIHFHANNVLEIGWEEFPHTTCFSTVWLREHCYSERAYTCRGIDGPARGQQTSKLWNGTFGSTFFSYSFQDVLESHQGVMGALSQLKKYGLVIFRGVPTSREFLQLGFHRLTSLAEGKLETALKDLSVSIVSEFEQDDRESRVHTTRPYEDPLPLLGAIHGASRKSTDKGISFIDGMLAAELLRTESPVSFSFLTSIPVTFGLQNYGMQISANRYVIQVDTHNLVTGIHYHNGATAPFSIAPDRMLDFYKAYQAFGRLVVNPHYQLHVSLRDDQLALFDNTRVLQGRKDWNSIDGLTDRESQTDSPAGVDRLDESDSLELCLS